MADHEGSKNRIKYALVLSGWSYEGGSKADLLAKAKKVVAADYEPCMEKNLFCPVCNTNLIRVPKDKAVFSNGRKACYSHISKYRDIDCDLRSTKPQGKLYLNEEEAKMAIEHNELVVIRSFLHESPNAQSIVSGIYDQTPVEDADGPTTEVSISRHNGETHRLPSKISTVNSLCRNFDENLYRYYFFPGTNAAVRLIDALVNIRDVTTTDDLPKLYYGVIHSSRNAGVNPKPTNLRMTKLHCHRTIKDFYLKDTDAIQLEKGISDTSAGRIVLLWGKVTENGIGLYVNKPGWGEYALLPEKYNGLLDADDNA